MQTELLAQISYSRPFRRGIQVHRPKPASSRNDVIRCFHDELHVFTAGSFAKMGKCLAVGSYPTREGANVELLLDVLSPKVKPVVEVVDKAMVEQKFSNNKTIV